MTWVKIDDQFDVGKRRVEDAGPDGPYVLIRAMCYSSRALTDGAFGDGAARVITSHLPGTRGPKALTRLVEVGLLHVPGHDCAACPAITSGYYIHDYLDYQPSKAQVKAEREIAKRRWAMNNDPELRKIVQGRDGPFCRYCARRVNWRDRKSESGGTYDHVLPLSVGGDESPDNIVVCCRACNTKKGARTPEVAGMPLLSPPNVTEIKPGSSTGSRRGSRHPVPGPEVPSEPSPHTPRGGGRGGSTSQPKDAWADVLQAIRSQGKTNKPAFLDPVIAAAVKRVGWARLCDLSERDGQRAFEAAFGQAQREAGDDVA